MTNFALRLKIKGTNDRKYDEILVKSNLPSDYLCWILLPMLIFINVNISKTRTFFASELSFGFEKNQSIISLK